MLNLICESKRIYFIQLTDLGHYVYSLPAPPSKGPSTPFVYVDGSPLSSDIKIAVITNDAQHILTEDKNNNWMFDNKPIKIGNPHDGVEVDGTTVYTYSVTN